jgi:hypothetical protein
MNTASGSFKYTITLQPAKGATVPAPKPLDPTVMND